MELLSEQTVITSSSECSGTKCSVLQLYHNIKDSNSKER